MMKYTVLIKISSPAGQEVQVDDPVEDVYVPDVHWVQETAPRPEKAPIGDIEQKINQEVVRFFKKDNTKKHRKTTTSMTGKMSTVKQLTRKKKQLLVVTCRNVIYEMCFSM